MVKCVCLGSSILLSHDLYSFRQYYLFSYLFVLEYFVDSFYLQRTDWGGRQTDDVELSAMVIGTLRRTAQRRVRWATCTRQTRCSAVIDNSNSKKNIELYSHFRNLTTTLWTNSLSRFLNRLPRVWFSVPSVLWHSWLGHLTRKNPSQYDLYCVGGMLINQSILNRFM